MRMTGNEHDAHVLAVLARGGERNEYDLCQAIHGTTKREDADYYEIRQSLRRLRDLGKITVRIYGGVYSGRLIK